MFRGFVQSKLSYTGFTAPSITGLAEPACLRFAPTALLHLLAISSSVQTHTSVSAESAAATFSVKKNSSTLKMTATGSSETLVPT